MEKNKYSILCVDDEKSILNALKRLLRKEGYNLLFAESGREGLEILKAHHVHMIISDQRMPEMSGSDFLAKVKEIYPDVLRVILTGYSDVDSITESINKGNIFKFFFKPWNDLRLKAEIRQIIEQLDLIRTNKHLDETVLKQNLELQDMNEKLEQLVKKRTHELEFQNHMLQLSHAILEDLPISVFGIDSDGIIVLANKMALSMLGQSGVKVGRPLTDCFTDEVADSVRSVIKTGHQVKVSGDMLNCNHAEASLLPLSGSFKGRGVILVF